MKYLLTSFFLITTAIIGFCQELTVVADLQDSTLETSGLIYLDGRLITHNDSGGDPILYELDSVTGHVSRTVVIDNASNTDWEDICYDDTYIYIADFGNNAGARTDLKVYRLLISDYLTTPNDTVSVDTINFSYLDQIDFTPSLYTTNFDAEAIISYQDTLLVFTKNWGNNWTNVYALPKNPGTYQVTLIDSVNAQGLVSGASYNDVTNTVALCGYTFTNPFIVEISSFTSTDFSSAIVNRHELSVPAGKSIQVEGITWFQNDQCYLTAELNFNGGTPTLYRVEMSTLSNSPLELNEVLIYPNPNRGAFYIQSQLALAGGEISVIDMTGKNVYHKLLEENTINTKINLNSVVPGIYIINVQVGNNSYNNSMIID